MNGNNYMKWLDHILNAVAIWPVTGQCFQNTEWPAVLYILSKFPKSKKPANLNYHLSIKKSQAIKNSSVAFALRWAQKAKPCFVTLRTFFRPTAGQSGIFNALRPAAMRGLGRFRNSQQAFAQGVKIPRPFAFLAVRQIGNISGKNEVISLYCALKCNGAQDEFFLF